MLTSASLFLGLRYLKPKRSFVSIIALLSVMGIMLSVGTLIVVVAVMKGFELDFKELLIGFESHVELQQSEPMEGDPPGQASKWQKVKPLLDALPGVAAASPFVKGGVFVKSGGRATMIEVHGLEPASATRLRDKLAKHLIPSDADQPKASLALDADVIVLSDHAAAQLGLMVGDKVTVFATANMPQVVDILGELSKDKTTEEKAKSFDNINELLVPQELTVAGILRSDSTWGRSYMPLHIAQELFGLRGRVHGINLELNDAHHAPAFLSALFESAQLPPDWSGDTWVDRHASRLAAIQNERVMMWFMLSLFVFVAAFSVSITILTSTVQKRREIGILSAMGMKAQQIIGVFMTQAGIVAVVGTILGFIGGLLILWQRNHIRDGLADLLGIKIFDKDVYFLAELPAHLESSDVIIVCVVSLLLCLIGAFIPAFLAGRVDPAVALRDT
jgi:lipoprotein-releasing system permease protein